MDLVIKRLTGLILVAGCLVAWFLPLIAHSPISPSPLILQHSYKREGPFAKNNVLQAVEKLGEGVLDRPEDTAVDSQELIYTATRDGWIKRMHLNGSWEDWKMVGSASLGLTVSKSGDGLVCMPNQGLLKVNDDQIFLLASEVDGIPIRLANAVVEASDVNVYFSDASTKFGADRFFLDLLEAKPHGRLLKYDPITKKTTVLLDGLGFRYLKHWIKGEKLGSTEISIENLPGGPDNINIATDGQSHRTGSHNILIGSDRLLGYGDADNIPEQLIDALNRIGIFFWSQAISAWSGPYPTWKCAQELGLSGHWNLKSQAMVVKVGEEGEPIISFDDSNGKFMSMVTSAMEMGDCLYRGSLKANFLGRLSADKFRD
eukprot:PITA_07581